MPPKPAETTVLTLAIVSAASNASTPFIIAIDGRSGSGKTTLAHQLAALLDAQVIESDDFYAGGTTVRTDDAASRAEACIDWRRIRPVLASLKAGQPATWRPFDWDAFDGRLGDTPRAALPARFVILEGVYSSRPELADLVDFHILVDVSAETRTQRLLKREGQLGPWERQWHAAEEHYFGVTLASHRFDAVHGR
ncbi:hypothetical protein [Arenimonas sp.]|uniref:uridine kinase family protein n=1 Tax=Arenimonas sp. TaxID=1872635 RepID=UPI002E37D04D|nr:hypothetical protein [Arenimonas sp.]HEX4854055.1 hypothetical protein [Arenimonas sp.]